MKTFKEKFIEEAAAVSEVERYLATNAARFKQSPNNVVAVITSLSKGVLSSFGIVYFTNEDGKAISDKEKDAIIAAKGDFTRNSITFKVTAKGYKVDKNIYGSFEDSYSAGKLLSEDEVLSILKKLP